MRLLPPPVPDRRTSRRRLRRRLSRELRRLVAAWYAPLDHLQGFIGEDL